jgi:putative ATP-dependent endonuclease of OLD family
VLTRRRTIDRGSSAESSGADVDPTASGVAKSNGSGADAGSMTKKLLRQFRSATLISIEGVDFEPYLRVLLDGDHPRIDRAVVVTDRDHTGAGDERRALDEERFARDVEAGRLTVVVGGTTVEAEMFRLPENEESLHGAFLTLHPQSDGHWANVVASVEGKGPDERAETFAAAIRAKSPSEDVYMDIAKGDFAHIVAEAPRFGGWRIAWSANVFEGHLEAVAHVDAEQE